MLKQFDIRHTRLWGLLDPLPLALLPLGSENCPWLSRQQSYAVSKLEILSYTARSKLAIPRPVHWWSSYTFIS